MGMGGGYIPYPDAPQPYGVGSPFASLMPSVFPPGTDPMVVSCFQATDRDGSGIIDDKELQGALSSYNQSFSIRTVHLLMYLYTGTNVHKIDEAKRERHVMIHRAILGSVERMLIILLEHYKGKWPFWLSPHQAIVCPVSEKSQPYALRVRDQIHQAGYYVDVDTTDRKIQKKGRTEKFKKDTMYSGSATFTYESFMLTVLPFLIA